MKTSDTNNQSNNQLNGGQEANLDNNGKPQARRYLRIVVNGTEEKHVEIRESEECAKLDSDALMVTYVAEDVADKMGADLSLLTATLLEQRASRDEQQDKKK